MTNSMVNNMKIRGFWGTFDNTFGQNYGKWSIDKLHDILE